MICHGTTRLVLILGPFAIKFPRIRIRSFLHWVRNAIKDLLFWKQCPCCYGKLHKQRGSINTDLHLAREALFSGFRENLQEARYYLTTRHRLLATLYLPLIFLNIYRREKGVGNFTFEEETLIRRVKAMGDAKYLRLIGNCAHTFDNPQNFSFDGTNVKILDYGNPEVQNLIEEYGDQIEQLLVSERKT